MTPEQLHIIQHSLGVDQYGRGSQYRNRFVTGPGTSDWTSCKALVEIGFMNDRGGHELYGDGAHCFCVTEAGKKAMAELSPKPPALTRSQKRYRAFLNADCGISFREWLNTRQI